MKDEISIDKSVVEQVEAVHELNRIIKKPPELPLSEVLLLFSEMASKFDEE
ncbi:MAG: hypothetical protein ACTH2W_10605 [Vagococcus sp.]